MDAYRQKPIAGSDACPPAGNFTSFETVSKITMSDVLRQFWKSGVVLGVLILAGCDPRLPESVGPAQEILVLIDPADRESLESHLKEVFERVLYTPQEEKLFWLKFGNLADFERYENKRRKNILIVATLDDPHPTAAFLRNILSPDVQDAVRRNRSAVFWKEDIWAKEQLLMAVSGNDRAGLVENLRMETDRLYDRVEAARNKRIRQLIYRYGERKDVTERLGREFGWEVRVAFGYRILEADPDSGFVVLTKEEPNRWLFVYWEDGIAPDLLSDEWCIRKRDNITQRFFDQDRIAQDYLEIGQAEFAGNLAFVLQGLWENKRKWAGGPFKSYAFVDVETNRFFYIDCGVYSPNKRKEPYLRQIDLMAQTFNQVDSTP